MGGMWVISFKGKVFSVPYTNASAAFHTKLKSFFRMSHTAHLIFFVVRYYSILK